MFLPHNSGTIARGVMDGGVPYRDFFDHKPPLIYGWFVVALFLHHLHVKIAIKRRHLAIGYQIQGIGSGTQQVSVVRDQHHATFVFLQSKIEGFTHFQIKVVGGFVEQQ